MNEETVLATFGTFAFVIGAAVGSFLNVVIRRLPEDRSVVLPASHCPVCLHPIRVIDNVPIVSWVLLRGRCRDCKTKISPVYPMLELLTAGLGWLTFRRFIVDPDAIDLPHLLAWGVFFTFCCLLLVAAFVDVKWRIILDESSIYAVPFAIFASFTLEWVGYDGWLGIGWRQSILGTAMGGGIFGAAAVIALWLLKKEGLGWGDVKLMAMIGAFVGPMPGTWAVMFLGATLGSVVGLVHLLVTRRRQYLPLGPSLSLAALVYVFYGDVLLRGGLPGIAAWLDL